MQQHLLQTSANRSSRNDKCFKTTTFFEHIHCRSPKKIVIKAIIPAREVWAWIKTSGSYCRYYIRTVLERNGLDQAVIQIPINITQKAIVEINQPPWLVWWKSLIALTVDKSFFQNHLFLNKINQFSDSQHVLQLHKDVQHLNQFAGPWMQHQHANSNLPEKKSKKFKKSMKLEVQ